MKDSRGNTYPALHPPRINLPASTRSMTVQVGLKWMGVMTLAVTVLLAFLHFPMWGSMFFPANPDYTEEDYYIKEWTAEEVAKVSRGGVEAAYLPSQCTSPGVWPTREQVCSHSFFLAVAAPACTNSTCAR